MGEKKEKTKGKHKKGTINKMKVIATETVEQNERMYNMHVGDNAFTRARTKRKGRRLVREEGTHTKRIQLEQKHDENKQ